MNDMKNSLSVDQLLTDLEQMQDQIELYQRQISELKEENMQLMLQKNKLEERVESQGEIYRSEVANIRYQCKQDADRQIKQDTQTYVYRERNALQRVEAEKEKGKRSEMRARTNMFFCLCAIALLSAYLFEDVMLRGRLLFLPGFPEAVVFWWMVFGLVMVIVQLQVIKRKK